MAAPRRDNDGFKTLHVVGVSFADATEGQDEGPRTAPITHIDLFLLLLIRTTLARVIAPKDLAHTHACTRGPVRGLYGVGIREAGGVSG